METKDIISSHRAASIENTPPEREKQTISEYFQNFSHPIVRFFVYLNVVMFLCVILVNILYIREWSIYGGFVILGMLFIYKLKCINKRKTEEIVSVNGDILLENTMSQKKNKTSLGFKLLGIFFLSTLIFVAVYLPIGLGSRFEDAVVERFLNNHLLLLFISIFCLLYSFFELFTNKNKIKALIYFVIISILIGSLFTLMFFKLGFPSFIFGLILLYILYLLYFFYNKKYSSKRID